MLEVQQLQLCTFKEERKNHEDHAIQPAIIEHNMKYVSLFFSTYQLFFCFVMMSYNSNDDTQYYSTILVVVTTYAYILLGVRVINNTTTTRRRIFFLSIMLYRIWNKVIQISNTLFN